MDRTTKMLLAAIAAGIWVNTTATLIQPARANPEDWLGKIAVYAQSIAGDMKALVGNSTLNCKNPKLCGLRPLPNY
jgi:hypothetical protein